MATNDITGDTIQSKTYSDVGRLNHDRIFAKKTAHKWLSETYPGILIYDPDGWRQGDGVTLDTPITFSDFQYRLNLSTVMGSICQQ